MIYQYIIAALSLFIPALAGIAILARSRILREKTLTLATGSIIGIVTFSTISYAIGHILALTRPVLWFELITFLAIALWLAWRGGYVEFMGQTHDKTATILLVLSLLLFTIIAPKLLIEKSDGLYTGIINAYGDIGWHTAIIMEIAEQKMLPIEDPIFAGNALTYPYLANLLSATMVILGASLSASVNVPGVLLIPMLLVLLYSFGKTYGGSRTAGIVALLLFLFGGATFGWTRIAQDISQSREGIVEFLFHLPQRDYSGVGTDEQGFHFLNPVTTLLLPQRAMLFGMPLVLTVLLLLHPKIIKRRFAPTLAGIAAGMLPLLHAHACIALAAAILALFIISGDKKRFGLFAIPALIIGIPELTFFVQGNAEGGSFFRYGPGWMVGNMNPILYWFQNTGVLIPASILVLFSSLKRESKALIIAGTFLFILANTFLFAPWTWDNFKLFVFWFILILPGIGYGAALLLHHSRFVLIPVLVCTLIIIHTLAAGLDIWKLAIPTARVWGEWTREGIEMAEILKREVPVTTPVLTASVHNSPATLAGRKLILGYAPHIWSHGGLPWNREQEVKEFFEGRTNTIEGIRPQAILIGPQERSAYSAIVIRPEWQIVAIHGSYQLYVAP
jgi:hypothetical protein